MRKLLHNFCICQHSLNCVVTMWTTKLFSPLWLLNVNLQTHPTRENFCTMFASVCNISIAVTFKLSCPSPHPRWLSCQPTCASPENLSLKTFKFIKSKSKILGVASVQMACVQKYGVANVTKTGVANVSKRGVANVQMAYVLPPSKGWIVNEHQH